MVSNKKIDRALNGPGMFEITLGVLFSLSAGVLLAALHLIFKPVTVVDKPPETAERGQVYFVQGSADGSKARQGTRKRQMLAEGNPANVSFNEEELNAWMASATQQPQAGTPGPASELFTPETVNFRIQQGLLQIGLQGKLAAAGFTRKLVFQTRGKFVPGAKGFEFAAEEFYIGSLPTHLVPGLTPYLIKRVLAAQELPEDLQATWKKLKLVAVEDNSLRLVLP
jgi:hypothetical protein